MSELQETLTGTLSGTAPIQPQGDLHEIPNALRLPDTNENDFVGSIKNLKESQQKPNVLMDFQKVMGTVARESYKGRQASELSNLGFDPSKVSGNTFASIISNFEQSRGVDVGKLYSQTLNTYIEVQNQITQRLNMFQQLEQEKKKFEENLKLEKKRIKLMAREDKQQAKLAKMKLDQDQAQFEATMAERRKGASTDSYSQDYFKNLTSGFSQITMGQDGYLDPREFNSWAKDAMANASTAKDLSALNTMMSKGMNLLNPNNKRSDSSTDTEEAINKLFNGNK